MSAGILKRVALMIIVSTTLGACQSSNKQTAGTLGGAALGGLLGSQFGSSDGKIVATIAGVAAGAWLGSQLGAYLDEQDQAKASVAAQNAALTGTSQSWNNPDTGNSGTAIVTDTSTVTDQVPVKVSKGRIEQVPPLNMSVSGIHAATANSNVRGGPGTEYEVVGSVRRGETVEVTGKVLGADWYLVTQDGVGMGFIHANLLKSLEAGGLNATAELGAPSDIEEVQVAAQRPCRTITQAVTLADGTQRDEDVTACQGKDGWEIQ